MTQEEKDLLLKDLCARLPYGVKIKLGDYDYQVCGYNSEKEMPVKIWYYYNSNLTLKSYIDVYLTDYRPYLRSMSSMTEEEKKEISNLLNYEFYVDTDYALSAEDGRHRVGLDLIQIYINWLLKNHFDFMGLIPKCLAIEVTNENNPYKE